MASASTLNYYIGFTPSCNKDGYTTSILGVYSTKGEAEQWLTKWMSKYIEDMAALDLFKVETYEDKDYKIDVSEILNSYPYIQQYIFDPEVYEIDYEEIIGHELTCLHCASYTPSFWIIGAESHTLPGTVRNDLESLIV